MGSCHSWRPGLSPQFPASAQPSPSCCRNLGSEPADGNSTCLCDKKLVNSPQKPTSKWHQCSAEFSMQVLRLSDYHNLDVSPLPRAPPSGCDSDRTGPWSPRPGWAYQALFFKAQLRQFRDCLVKRARVTPPSRLHFSCPLPSLGSLTGSTRLHFKSTEGPDVAEGPTTVHVRPGRAQSSPVPR